MNHRRDFIKKSLIGLSGAALIPSAAQGTNFRLKEELPVRTLGKTGLKIPVLSMGTGDTNNPALVKSVLESGVKLFGTSTYYGNGNNEAMLGQVFKGLPRDSFMVATSSMPKGTDHQNGLFTDPSAGEAFKADIEASMKRLNVDYLDILFLPFAAKKESVFFEPLLRTMEDFKKSGKARYIGIATHSFSDQAVTAAADTGIYDVVMMAYNFRMNEAQAVKDAIDYGAKAGLGFIVMKSMAGGYWDSGRTQPINSQAALKWVLKNPNMHTVMSGMTTFDELQANLALLKDLNMTDQELKDLRLASAGEPGLFCLQCQDCRDQCKQNVDIPTLMRSYMYAYGYRNMHHARQTFDMAAGADACGECDNCSVVCSAGFDVKEKIRNISRIGDVPEEFLA
ncbi:MAG TPA: aldo/keto reductase [Bacteroidales bacterium]|nr:aldo/keto reductase [Bacteroidales bacterium]